MKGTELLDKIRDEMAAAKNGYIDMMGELMTEYLRIHPDAEIDEKRTMKGAYDALRDIARKKQKGNCYAMPPQEVFGSMMDYFELPHADADYRSCMLAMLGQTTADAPAAVMSGEAVPEIREAAARRQEVGEPEKADVDDLFDLDALLGV